MIKGCLVGLGKMGLSHAAILGAMPNVDMVGLCDTSSFILDAFRKLSTLPVFDDFDKMLDKAKPDFLVVAVPTKFHYAMVKKALDRNIHVFCEKPFCLEYQQGVELETLARSKGLINQVGYHNHFVGTFKELKKVVAQKVIGDIVYFQGEAYGPVVLKSKGGTWRSKPQDGGGCLYDYASHVLNLVQGVLGNTDVVLASTLPQIHSKSVEDAVYAMLKLKSGLVGNILVNWSDDTCRKMTTSLTLMGTDGKIFCDATELRVFLRNPRPDLGLDRGWNVRYITELATPVEYHLRGEEYSDQLASFVHAVETKQPVNVNSFADGLETDLTIKMILEKVG
jgi:predicted dehydrogenase